MGFIILTLSWGASPSKWQGAANQSAQSKLIDFKLLTKNFKR